MSTNQFRKLILYVFAFIGVMVIALPFAYVLYAKLRTPSEYPQAFEKLWATSQFSNMDEASVNDALVQDLMSLHPSIEFVEQYMSGKGVQYCERHSVYLNCSTSAQAPANTNPLSRLTTNWRYRMRFMFAENRLVEIRIDTIDIGF